MMLGPGSKNHFEHILNEKEMVEIVYESSEASTEDDDSEEEVIRDQHGKVIREKK